MHYCRLKRFFKGKNKRCCWINLTVQHFPACLKATIHLQRQNVEMHILEEGLFSKGYCLVTNHPFFEDVQLNYCKMPSSSLKIVVLLAILPNCCFASGFQPENKSQYDFTQLLHLHSALP